jgi:hypothetical protein
MSNAIYIGSNGKLAAINPRTAKSFGKQNWPLQ